MYKSLGCILFFLLLSCCINPTGCDDIDDSDVRDYCYFTLNMGSGDIATCSKIVNLTTRDLCYESVAYVLENISVCDLIADVIERQTCRDTLAELNGSLGLEDISAQNLTANVSFGSGVGEWDMQYFELAVAAENPELCKEIGNDSLKNLCFTEINLSESHNMSLVVSKEVFVRGENVTGSFLFDGELYVSQVISFYHYLNNSWYLAGKANLSSAKNLPGGTGLSCIKTNGSLGFSWDQRVPGDDMSYALAESGIYRAEVNYGNYVSCVGNLYHEFEIQ